MCKEGIFFYFQFLGFTIMFFFGLLNLIFHTVILVYLLLIVNSHFVT
jgi:hypothetical protein